MALPDEPGLTEAVAGFFITQGVAVESAIETIGTAVPVESIPNQPAVRSALDETDEELESGLLGYLPAFFLFGWEQAAQQLDAADIDAGSRPDADARNQVRETIPGIHHTTVSALQAAAEAANQFEDPDEAVAAMQAGVAQLYEKWQVGRAELISVTEGMGAIGRAGNALAAIVAATQLVQKHNIDRGDEKVCVRCINNTAAGWIMFADYFPSGHLARPYHPRCRCRTEYRIVK